MKINVKNEKKLQEKINEVERGCKARLLSISEITDAVERAEIKLLEELEVPKKYWIGTKILIFPPGTARNYYGTAHGTYCEIERYKTGWFVVKIERIPCNFADASVRLHLSEQTIQAIPDRFYI